MMSSLEGEGGSGYPPKVMTSFMNSPRESMLDHDHFHDHDICLTNYVICLRKFIMSVTWIRIGTKASWPLMTAWRFLVFILSQGFVGIMMFSSWLIPCGLCWSGLVVITMKVMVIKITRSSWLNRALQDDEALYWVSKVQQCWYRVIIRWNWLFLDGTWSE